MVVKVDDQLRRRLLVARQQLGVTGRDKRSIQQTAAALGLLHSTDPSTPYLMLHARTAASRPEIDAAFYDDRCLLRHTTLRRTVFALPLEVVPLAHNSYNDRLVRTLRSKLLGWIAASPDTSEPAERFLARAEHDVVDWLRHDGPATGRSLAAAVPALQVSFDSAPGASYSKPMRITSRVLELLAADGRIARGRPTGRDFTSGAWTWGLIDDWVGPAGIPLLDHGEALTGLVARYLAVFAPATVTDLAWWTGLPRGQIRTALQRCGAIEVTLDDVTEVGHVLGDDDLEAPAVAGSVALLPGLDSTTMGWKQRRWYVDDRPAVGLFDRNGNAGPTIWIDGQVVGSWTQRADGEIVTQLTVDVGTVGLAQIDGEIERMGTWLGDVRVNWRYPTPITRQLSK